MENIYCLSGLGADERIFKRINIEGAKLVHLPWVPFEKTDALPHYAEKMAAQIPEKEPFILGLSFGGMLATEIATQQNVKQIFIVSSAKGRHELPPVNLLFQYFIRHRLVPYGLFKTPNKIMYDLFGAVTPDEKELLAAIIRDTDISFVRWAAKAILDWKNTEAPSGIIHIHGLDDKILKPEFVDATHWIEGGTHIMIYNRAEEISSLISQHIFT